MLLLLMLMLLSIGLLRLERVVGSLGLMMFDDIFERSSF
uniref:Uncharacterized protein n=1 Tax=Phakopsora pachyrhizi TaxID=170000 RepID=A0A0S1MJE5_PHAPC